MNLEYLLAAGVDCDGALQRFVGNETLFSKYLGKFLDDEHVDAAVKAFEDRNYDEVLAQVHALKGLSGTLGLSGVYEESQIIVNKVRNNDYEELDVHMKQLVEQQQSIIAVIKKTLEEA